MSAATSSDYLEHNRAHWDAMVDAHWESDFYDVPGWLAGNDSLGEIELSMLPQDLKGQRLPHLQCHFGQDTLSLARRGAVGMQVFGDPLSREDFAYISGQLV